MVGSCGQLLATISLVQLTLTITISNFWKNLLVQLYSVEALIT